MNCKIPTRNLENFRSKMEKISSKCAKYGCAFSYKEIGLTTVEAVVGHSHGVATTARISAMEVEVEGIASIKGWKFLAQIEHHETGNIVRSYVEADPSWFTCEPKCDHCNVKTFRKVTYIIENESGERKQVGASCLKLYTGGLDAEACAIAASALSIPQEYYNDLEEGLSSSEILDWELNDFLSVAIQTIKTYGYVKESFAEKFNEVKDGHSFASEEEVKEFLKWDESRSSASDFEQNAKNVIALGYVNLSKHIRILGAYVSKWLKERAKSSKKPSEYLGNKGDKVELRISNPNSQIVCLYIKTVQVSYYKSVHTPVLKITDDNGNVAIYKGNAIDFGSYWSEDSIVIRATIKEISEFRGEKQTTIERPKVYYIVDGKEVAF